MQKPPSHFIKIKIVNWLTTRLQIDCNGIGQMLIEQTNHREMKTHDSNKNNVKNNITNRENHKNNKTMEQNYQQQNMAKTTYKWKTQIRMKNRTKENDCNHFLWHILGWHFAINKWLASKITKLKQILISWARYTTIQLNHARNKRDVSCESRSI